MIGSYQDIDISRFIHDFAEWFNTWSQDVSAPFPQFEDPITTVSPGSRKLAIGHIRSDVDRLLAIVKRETEFINRHKRNRAASSITPAQLSQARASQFTQMYDPPGEFRSDGPRHDNDHADISRIRIAPTHDEIFSPIPPYLPIFSSDAPHHHPPDSMERHLDIQFRLLREELMYVSLLLFSLIPH